MGNSRTRRPVAWKTAFATATALPTGIAGDSSGAGILAALAAVGTGPSGRFPHANAARHRARLPGSR